MIHLGPARRRPGTDPPRPVRQPRLRRPPRTQAMLYAMEARAYANMGQRQQVPPRGPDGRGHLRRRRARRRPDPDWIRFFSEAELHARERPLLPRPRLCRRPQPHLRLAGPARDAAGRRRCSARTRSTSAPTRSTSIGMATVHLLKRRARAGRRTCRAGHDGRQAGPLRAGQHPYPQDRRTARDFATRRGGQRIDVPPSVGAASSADPARRPRDRSAGRDTPVARRCRRVTSPATSPRTSAVAEPGRCAPAVHLARNTRDFFVTAAKHRAASAETALRPTSWRITGPPLALASARAVPTTRRRRWHQPS